MQKCVKCSGTNVVHKSGFKKNGEPWQGTKCVGCGHMQFANSGGSNAGSYKKPYGAPSQSSAVITQINTKLDRIISILINEGFEDPQTASPEENTVDADPPF